MITPPILRKGDTVGIIAPARKIKENEIIPFLELLSAWGLKYKMGKFLYGQHHQYSGTDSERATDLQNMIDDPDVRAIICARGGYGTIRIIPQIDFTAFEKDPKWIAGFSDITVLHSYVNKYLGTESLHSLMPIQYIPGETDAAAESLRKALFGEKTEYQIKPNRYNKNGNFTGELAGGNLSLLYSINGTSFFPDMKSKILFIEDVDEYLYHIDRIMHNFLHSGVFFKTGALIVGAFSNMRDNEIPFGSDIYEIITDTIHKFDFPVCFDFPCGHFSENLTLISGREMQLSVQKEGVVLSQ